MTNRRPAARIIATARPSRPITTTYFPSDNTVGVLR